MIGIYRIYEAGRLIATAPNLITTEGARAVLRYLSGERQALATSIGVGVGATPATAADRRLTFELERATVTVSSADTVNQRIIYKCTLSQGLTAQIYELGAFTNEFGEGSRSLVNFEPTEAWTGGAFSTVNARNGVNTLRLSPAASATSIATVGNLGLDLSSFSTIDEFSLAYQHVSNIATLRIRFYAEDGTSYYQYSFTPTAGYNVVRWTKTNMTKVGTVDYSAIASIEFAATATAGGAGTIDLDGLRVEDKDYVDPRAAMISHTVLASPITKTSVSPMEIEYALDMTIT